jgi:hypothetical protein
MSGVFRTIDPPPPSPCLSFGGRTHSLGGEGWGVTSSENARHCSVLYICKNFVIKMYTNQKNSIACFVTKQNPGCLIHSSFCPILIHTAKTKYRNFETNIPRKGISGSQFQFLHSCVWCERFIYYIPTIGLPVLLEEIRSWDYINRSQTHEC